MVVVTGFASIGPFLAGALMTWNFPFFDGQESKYSIRWAMVLIHSGSKLVLYLASFILIFTLPMDINALTKFYDVDVKNENMEK
jgi:hypothetical protein